MYRTILPNWGAPLCVAAVLLLPSPRAEAQPGKYETGYQNLVRLTQDLYRALPPEARRKVDRKLVLLQDVPMPYLQPMAYKQGGASRGVVCLSSGFIDFMNYYSHAKALEELDKNFFVKYMAGLAHETGQTKLHDLRFVSHRQTWSFDTMNHQVSTFNQVAGTLIAIDLAHHYLGHYQKYAAQLQPGPNGTRVPIASVVTPKEWRQAVLKGARNALDCGLGVEGIINFFQALDKMPNRPAWTTYFMPHGVKVSKIRRDLLKMERKFFAFN